MLPATIVLAELAKWTFPFGGVPLANLALTQAGSCAPPCTQLDSPLAQASRLLGPLLVVALVVIGGHRARRPAWERRVAGRRHRASPCVVVVTGLGMVAPRATTPARSASRSSRAVARSGPAPATSDSRKVFERHVQATEDLVTTPVDLIVWPENVVAVEGRLEANDEFGELQELAMRQGRHPDRRHHRGASARTHFLNASVVFDADGTSSTATTRSAPSPSASSCPSDP